MITKKFEELILTSVLRGDTSVLPENFYLGLCNARSVDREMTMEDVGEISGSGYTRLEVPRTATGWLEPQPQTDCLSIRTRQSTFTPTGTWTPFIRMFLCTAASGTDCDLLAVSSPLPLESTLTDGQSYTTAFELFLK